jgi:hypothetical protein
MARSIITSPEYFLVSVPNKKYAWENANPAPRKATLEARQKYWAKQKAAWAKATDDCKAAREKLKAAGLPTERRFQYEETAKKYAAEIMRDHGVEVEVCRAFDMAF